MEFTDTRLVEAFRAADLIEAHTIQIAMEAAGIQAEIDGEDLQGGEYPLGWCTAPRLLVAESQVNTAREIIQRAQTRRIANLREDENDEPLCCLACGQTMGKTDNCSACGWTYQAQTVGQHK